MSDIDNMSRASTMSEQPIRRDAFNVNFGLLSFLRINKNAVIEKSTAIMIRKINGVSKKLWSSVRSEKARTILCMKL